MRTCQRCGNILIPKRIKNKIVLYCRKCDRNYSFNENLVLESKVKKESEEAILISRKEREKNLPKTKVTCPKCGNDEAYYYLQQTRSADEPPTVFYTCTKCGYSWRSFE